MPYSTDHHRNFSRCLFVSFLAAFALRTRLALLNRRNKRTLETEGLSYEDKGDVGEEIWDNDPRYVFMTWYPVWWSIRHVSTSKPTWLHFLMVTPVALDHVWFFSKIHVSTSSGTVPSTARDSDRLLWESPVAVLISQRWINYWRLRTIGHYVYPLCRCCSETK